MISNIMRSAKHLLAGQNIQHVYVCMCMGERERERDSVERERFSRERKEEKEHIDQHNILHITMH